MYNKDNKNNNKDQNNKNYYLGYGIGFGLIGGALLSSITGIFIELPLIWTFGPGLGVLIGMVIGAIRDKNKNNK